MQSRIAIVVGLLSLGALVVIVFVMKGAADFDDRPPIFRASAKCRKEVSDLLYSRAVTLEKQRNLGAATATFSALCDGGYNWPAPPLENPCDASARLSRHVRKAYENVMSVLSDYRAKQGKYPETLVEILPRLPADDRDVVANFAYCRRESPSDEAKKCADGSRLFGDGEITIMTGEYGGVSFNLGRPDPRAQRVCEDG